MKKFFVKLIIPILGAVVGLWATNCFNIFSFVTFLNDNQAFDICVTVYFAFSEAALELLFDFAYGHFFSSSISVVISPPGVKAGTDTETTIVMKNGIGEAEMHLGIQGRNFWFRKAKIEIPALASATIQPNQNMRGVTIEQSGNYVIDIPSLIGKSPVVDVQEKFRILLAMESDDGSRREKMCVTVRKKTVFVRFKSNCAYIQMGE